MMSGYLATPAHMGFASVLCHVALADKSEIPLNARLDSSDFGWYCLPGYLRTGNVCHKIKLPDNAYLTGGTHGRGWACETKELPAFFYLSLTK
ncbi:MAG: hypothetical protein ACR2PG_21435 [Hyphomicrobiaceae bacterium]